MITRSRSAWASLSLCLIIFVLFWPVFMQGKVLVAGDIPYYDSFFLSEPYARQKTPLNLSVSDQIEQFYVWRKVAADSMQQEGHIPLWNPYEFAGQPLVGNAQSALFFPPNLLLFFLSPAKVATLNKIFILLLSGIFTFLLGRELKISDLAAFLSSIAFTFSGPLITFLGHPHANVLALFPLMMWAGEKLLLQNNQFMFWSAVLGSAMGVSLLGGHPETTFYSWVVIAVYFSARILFDRQLKLKGRLFSSFLLAGGIGVLIGGIQLLPFAESLLHSTTLSDGRSVAGVAEQSSFLSIKEFFNNVPQVITLICPNFYGNPLSWSYLWPFASLQSYSDRAIYFGTVPVALALGTLFTVPRRQPWLIISFLTIFCLGIAWHFPILEWVNLLPLFSKGISLRMTFQFNFFAAIMAGIGFDLLMNELKSETTNNKVSHLFAVCICSTLLVCLAITGIRFSPLFDLLPQRFQDCFPPIEFKTYLPSIMGAAVFLSYSLFVKLRRNYDLFFASIVVISVIELVGFAWGYNPTVHESEILPLTAPISLMKASAGTQPFRMLRTDEILHANYSAAYGIPDISGYDAPISKRYEQLYRFLGGVAVRDRQYWQPDWPLVDFLNVKYVLSKNPLSPDRFNPVYRTDSFVIYENRHVLPRAYMVYNNEVVTADTDILARMTNPGFDISRKVILEETVPLEYSAPPDYSAAYSIKYSNYSNDDVIMDISSERPGMLVMSDLYAPGWHALIDNIEVKIYRANYAFRSIAIPAGEHTVTLRYSPRSYTIGVTMTISGLLVVLSIAGFRLRDRLRSPVRINNLTE
jgi:hypothetical protein